MMPAAPRILLLDDDPGYAAQLAAYLEAHGFRVVTLDDPAGFDAVLETHRPDLVLLDQRLGATTGTDVLRALRARSAVPCIVVTGLPDATDRIVNLEIGADDEVDKSVPARELLARVRTVLRRSAQAGAAPPPAAEAGQVRRWDLSLARRELLRPDGSVCRLTTAEFELLRVLHETPGVPVSRDVLSQSVFGRPVRAGDRAVDTLVNKLRRKIEPGAEPTVIKTVRPIGYVFTGFPEPRG